MNTGVRISVAGGSEFGVSYTLDGVPHINNLDGTGMPLPFPDALQEFRIVTGVQEASGGLKAGASVNAVTRSGTNVFHGNAFEFLRDSRFNAPDFFSHQKDGLKRNQYNPSCGRNAAHLAIRCEVQLLVGAGPALARGGLSQTGPA